MKRFLTRMGLSYKQWIALAVLVFALVWVGRGTYNIYLRYKESKDQYDESTLEYQNLAGRQIQLQNGVESLGTARGVEGIARTKFNASKDGEELAIIISPATTTETATSSPKSWWQRIGSWFQ